MTPLQALAMYNGRLVNEEAKHFANRIRKETGPDADISTQLQLAFQIALSRLPMDDEQTSMAELLASTDSGLESVCRVLLNSNEFVFVD